MQRSSMPPNTSKRPSTGSFCRAVPKAPRRQIHQHIQKPPRRTPYGGSMPPRCPHCPLPFISQPSRVDASPLPGSKSTPQRQIHQHFNKKSPLRTMPPPCPHCPPLAAASETRQGGAHFSPPPTFQPPPWPKSRGGGDLKFGTHP